VDVLGAVRQEIENGRLLDKGATIVVGVSGGADSLCLLHVLNRLGADYDWSLHVAHLHHRLRGDDADEDMIFVALLAMDWKLPCTIEVINVKAMARQQRTSLEETARQIRYGFLDSVAQEVGATAVVVGHQADDQAETVLMHFLRGTGLAGLRGMSPAVDLGKLRIIRPSSPGANSDIQLVRPLLSVPRAEIERYCQAHSLSPRFDRSNLDTTFFRNRLRQRLLPELETYNPNVKTLLRRTAAVAAADYELLAAQRDEVWRELVRQEDEESVCFDLAGWRALPLALRRATLRQAAYRLRPRLRDVGFVHIEQAVAVATGGETGAQATLPQGLRLQVDYETLRLYGAESDRSTPDWPLLWHDAPLPAIIPGETALPGASRWRLEARLWNGGKDVVFDNPDRWTAYVDADRLGTASVLRTRKPGDRFQPLGMDGRSIQVADFMVNVKIPRRWRDHIPLLVHDRAGEEIVWLAGWRIDERVKITAQTCRVIRLRWRRRPSQTGYSPPDTFRDAKKSATQRAQRRRRDTQRC
jgi:tRNA(Ile)-lysidine synthase